MEKDELMEKYKRNHHQRRLKDLTEKQFKLRS